MAKLTLERRKVSDLTAYENNPRIIERAVPLVAESIRQVGYLNPIVIDEDGVILAGHTRLEALTENGIQEVDVIVAAGASEEQRAKYRLLDNKTGELATWDRQKLREEMEGLDFGPLDDFLVKDEAFEIRTGSSKTGEEGQQKVICPRCKAEVIA